MKLITSTLGKFIVVAIAVALVLTFIFASLIPSLGSFISGAFIKETNYVEKGSLASAPKLSCSVDNVTLPVGSEAKIFENITAQSSSGEDLISQLINDYAQDMSERKQVFVYKVNADQTSTLAPEIDTLSAGEWIVFYLIKDGRESAILKVPYSVV